MSKRGRILVADDEGIVLESTVAALRKEGYACDGVADAQRVREVLGQQTYDLLIADINMPGNTKLELIKEVEDLAAGMPTILITGYPSLETAMIATRLSVVGYLLKPFDFDELLHLARKGIARYKKLRALYAGEKRQNGAPAEEKTLGATASGGENNYVFENIVAKSAAMSPLIALIKKAAPTHSNVLISGETGVGKELIARAIHNRSLRQEANFIPVDCGALPAGLIESELFGYEKGAFTGATGRKHGLLEFAHHGTLFLDEISELEVSLQAKLLRVLQERQFRPLGRNELINVDIRVIAAMNRNPLQAIAEGRLREDLYYRLNVIPILVPPLRERREDLPLLIDHFLRQTVENFETEPKAFSAAAVARLQTYRWPGNVRQLRNVVERLVSLAPGPIIDTVDLQSAFDLDGGKPDESISALPFHSAKKRKVASFEKKYFHDLMKASNNDTAKAAEMAGVSERSIYRMQQRHGKP